MLRLATLAVLLALAAPAAAQITGTIPTTPTLRRDATVASDLVRIGDLVENCGDNAAVPIFRAPDLGQTGTVQVTRVLDAIRAHGLLVVDTRGLSEIVVTRASRTITPKDIEARIVRALAGQQGLGDAKNLLVSFEREVRTIQVEPTATADLQLTRIVYDPRSGRFDASFELPGSAVARRLSLRFTGAIVETVEAAMLTRPVARGEVIKATDVVVERRPKSETGADVIPVASDAIGLAARRPIPAGQPLRRADLMKPEIVQRNEPVTLVFEAPGMLLSVRGKALESGAEGDLVSVLNIQSKRTVQGVVSGPGRVTVAPTNARITANANPLRPQPTGQPRSE